MDISPFEVSAHNGDVATRQRIRVDILGISANVHIDSNDPDAVLATAEKFAAFVDAAAL